MTTTWAAEPDLPLPPGTEMVIFLRPGAAVDPALQSQLDGIKILSYYLGLVNLKLNQVDEAIVFMPYNRRWVDSALGGNAQILPSGGGIIFRGDFDAITKFKALKKGNWREKQYANRKILWWSTGEKYLLNGKTGEGMALLHGKEILIGGSEEDLKRVLDVAGDKTNGLTSDGVYQRLAAQFAQDSRTALGIFVMGTDAARQHLKDAIDTSQYPILNTLISYSDRLAQLGLAMRESGREIQLDSYLGMDSDNTAMVLSGILQLGGGLAGYVPPNSPGRALLTNLQVGREENVVIGRTRLSERELRAMMQQR